MLGLTDIIRSQINPRIQSIKNRLLCNTITCFYNIKQITSRDTTKQNGKTYLQIITDYMECILKLTHINHLSFVVVCWEKGGLK